MRFPVAPWFLAAALPALALLARGEVAGTGPASAPAATAAASAAPLFDGQPKVIRFYTNSHGAAVYLSRKLNRYGKETFGTDGLYKVNPKDDARADAEIHHHGHGLWQAAYEVGIRPPKGQPQYQIRSPDDKENLERGVQALEKYQEKTAAGGSRRVFMSSMHYHQSYTVGRNPNWQNEALAYHEYNRRHGGNLAIDVQTATMKAHPFHLSDMYHPNRAGHEIYSHVWFAALLAHEGRPVPDWSAKEMDDAVALAKAEAAAVQVTPAGGETYKTGDTLTVTWKIDPSLRDKVKRLRIGISRDHWNTQWLGFADDPAAGKFEWTIPANWLDSKDKKTPPQPCDTCRIIIMAGQGPSFSPKPFTVAPR